MHLRPHRSSPWWRRTAPLRRRARNLPVSVRALAWAVGAGLLFSVLNATMRRLAIELGPIQTQCLRFVATIVLMAPLGLYTGAAAWIPRSVGGQFLRGAVHTVAMGVWISAIPFIALADTTAIGFMTPIFVMLGAALLFGEQLRWERWLTAALGFAGVLTVVWPHLSAPTGPYSLLMLASSPLFAASFLMTKGMTRYERPQVIVLWQAITVALFTLPLALWFWHWPTPGQWAGFLICGVAGSAGQYSLTRAFAAADLSATQPAKFLDLLWATSLGWLVFGDRLSESTLLGGVVICGATVWLARRELRRRLSS